MTATWLGNTGQVINASKSLSFEVNNLNPVDVSLSGEVMPRKKNFKSLGIEMFTEPTNRHVGRQARHQSKINHTLRAPPKPQSGTSDESTIHSQRSFSEPEVMKMSFGTNIVPSTQQLYRSSGKGGGHRDQRIYAADYRPSIPNQLERTPLTSAPPQRETTTLQNSAGGGHVVAIAPIDPALNGMYSLKQLQYDSESSGEAEVRTPPSSAPLWVGTESDSDHHSTEHDTDSSIEYDYPSSESWEPTPQHRRRPRALPDSPQDEPNTNAKRMKKSRRKTGGRADTPTVLHLRDREVTRKRITLSELNVKKRSKAPQDCHQKSPKVTNANKRGRA